MRLSAGHGVPVICQKPMATSLAEAEGLVAHCRAARVPFLVHENWRWQSPLRRAREVLDSGAIGAPFRARIEMVSGFAVFVNQPGLRTLDQFLLADMGSHILDLARFLFGEAESLYCHTHGVHADIRGEDVATVLLRMGPGRTSVVVQDGIRREPARARMLPADAGLRRGRPRLAGGGAGLLGPGDDGGGDSRSPPCSSAASPGPTRTTRSCTRASSPASPTSLEGIKGSTAETTAEDNLRTVRLVFAAYESARCDGVIRIA